MILFSNHFKPRLHLFIHATHCIILILMVYQTGLLVYIVYNQLSLLLSGEEISS